MNLQRTTARLPAPVLAIHPSKPAQVRLDEFYSTVFEVHVRQAGSTTAGTPDFRPRVKEQPIAREQSAGSRPVRPKSR